MSKRTPNGSTSRAVERPSSSKPLRGLHAHSVLHPDTEVIAIASGLNQNYQTYPYGDYEGLNNSRTLFPQGDLDARRPPQDRVLGIPFESGGGMAFPFNALDAGGGPSAVHARADGRDLVVFWDHESKAAAAYESAVDGQEFDFDVSDGRYVDAQTGSVWSLDGRAVAGEMEGQRLVQVADAYVAFWFAWAAFVPTTDLWLTGKPSPGLSE